jgi:hypothetical protein
MAKVNPILKYKKGILLEASSVYRGELVEVEIPYVNKPLPTNSLPEIKRYKVKAFAVYCNSHSWNGFADTMDKRGDGSPGNPYRNAMWALRQILCELKKHCYKPFFILYLSGEIDYFLAPYYACTSYLIQMGYGTLCYATENAVGYKRNFRHHLIVSGEKAEGGNVVVKPKYVASPQEVNKNLDYDSDRDRYTAGCLLDGALYIKNIQIDLSDLDESLNAGVSIPNRQYVCRFGGLAVENCKQVCCTGGIITYARLSDCNLPGGIMLGYGVANSVSYIPTWYQKKNLPFDTLALGCEKTQANIAIGCDGFVVNNSNGSVAAIGIYNSNIYDADPHDWEDRLFVECKIMYSCTINIKNLNLETTAIHSHKNSITCFWDHQRRDPSQSNNIGVYMIWYPQSTSSENTISVSGNFSQVPLEPSNGPFRSISVICVGSKITENLANFKTNLSAYDMTFLPNYTRWGNEYAKGTIGKEEILTGSEFIEIDYDGSQRTEKHTSRATGATVTYTRVLQDPEK